MKSIPGKSRTKVRRTSKILPPPEGTGHLGLRAPQSLLVKLDEIAESWGHDRSAVVLFFLRWALAEFEKEQREQKESEGTKA